MTKPEISVVVPHYEDLAGLDRCLTALSAQIGLRGRYEIIVADNASPSGEARVAEVIGGRARMVIATERGAGPARNAGAAQANGDLLAFTDSDCVPEAGWLAAGIDALSRGDIVGGAMTVMVPEDRPMSGAEAFERVFAFDNRSYVETKGFTVTANLLCRKTVFEAVGPFRSDVSEDVEWCRRAASKGFSLVYAGTAVVAHPARRDWGELKRKWKRMNSEGFGLVRGKPMGRVRWLARNLIMPVSVVAHVPRVWLSPALPNMRSRFRALGTLARLRLWRAADGIALVFDGRP